MPLSRAENLLPVAFSHIQTFSLFYLGHTNNSSRLNDLRLRRLPSQSAPLILALELLALVSSEAMSFSR